MKKLRLHGGTIVNPGVKPFAGDLILGDDKILGIVPPDSPKEESHILHDISGYYLSPGFVDIHTHGAGGFDFMDDFENAENYLSILKTHRAHGTTAIMPTSLSADFDLTRKAILRYKKAEKAVADECCLLGLHLEGPYLSPAQSGAQKPEHIRNFRPEEYRALTELAEGSIKRWSVAPELEGAKEFSEYALSHGITLSIAHTDADFDTVLQAYEWGFHHITHMYSCMSTIHRENGFRIAGAVEAAYYLDDMNVELIADGCHLPLSLLKLVLHGKSIDRIALVTDSMRAAGTGESTSFLGSREDPVPVIIEDGVAKLMSRTAFGGSICTSDRLVRTILSAGARLEDAIQMVTVNPLRMMNCSVKKGIIREGYDADLCIFDRDIRMKSVLVGGKDPANGIF